MTRKWCIAAGLTVCGAGTMLFVFWSCPAITSRQVTCDTLDVCTKLKEVLAGQHYSGDVVELVPHGVKGSRYVFVRAIDPVNTSVLPASRCLRAQITRIHQDLYESGAVFVIDASNRIIAWALLPRGVVVGEATLVCWDSHPLYIKVTEPNAIIRIIEQ